MPSVIKVSPSALSSAVSHYYESFGNNVPAVPYAFNGRSYVMLGHGGRDKKVYTAGMFIRAVAAMKRSKTDMPEEDFEGVLYGRQVGGSSAKAAPEVTEQGIKYKQMTEPHLAFPKASARSAWGVPASMRSNPTKKPSKAKRAARKTVKQVKRAARKTWGGVKGAAKGAVAGARRTNPVTEEQRKRMRSSSFAIPKDKKYAINSAPRAKYALTLLDQHYRSGARTKKDYVTAYCNIMKAFQKYGLEAKRAPLVKTASTQRAFEARATNPAKRQKVFFHASPTENRKDILQQGLLPGESASYGPPGVYLFRHELLAENYISDEDLDVWRVSVGKTPVHPDPEDPESAVYTTKSIPPSSLKLLGTFRNGEPVQDEDRIPNPVCPKRRSNPTTRKENPVPTKKATKAADKIVASSFERYNGGVRIKRLWGSSTVTRFYVYKKSDRDDPKKWKIIEGFGKTPGERKTQAIGKFKAGEGVSAVRSNPAKKRAAKKATKKKATKRTVKKAAPKKATKKVVRKTPAKKRVVKKATKAQERVLKKFSKLRKAAPKKRVVKKATKAPKRTTMVTIGSRTYRYWGNPKLAGLFHVEHKSSQGWRETKNVNVRDAVMKRARAKVVTIKGKKYRYWGDKSRLGLFHVEHLSSQGWRETKNLSRREEVQDLAVKSFVKAVKKAPKKRVVKKATKRVVRKAPAKKRVVKKATAKKRVTKRKSNPAMPFMPRPGMTLKGGWVIKKVSSGFKQVTIYLPGSRDGGYKMGKPLTFRWDDAMGTWKRQGQPIPAPIKSNPAKDVLHFTTRTRTSVPTKSSGKGRMIKRYYVLLGKDWVQVNSKFAKNSLSSGSAVKVPWSHGSLPHHKPNDVVSDEALGLMMHNWHSSMSDPIYGAGSTLFAGKRTSKASLARALSGIRSLRANSRYAKNKELRLIEKNLEHRVGVRKAAGAAKARPNPADLRLIKGKSKKRATKTDPNDAGLLRSLHAKKGTVTYDFTDKYPGVKGEKLRSHLFSMYRRGFKPANCGIDDDTRLVGSKTAVAKAAAQVRKSYASKAKLRVVKGGGMNEAMRRASKRVASKIGVKTIKMGGEVPDYEVHAPNAWMKASRHLASLAVKAPTGGACDKVHFSVTFVDGEVYRGRYDLQRQHVTSANLSEHVRKYVEFCAGKRRPAHMSESQYKGYLARLDTKAWAKFLTKYDLG